MYSYDEDDMVLDSKLPEHLAHFGIDMMTMEKASSVFVLLLVETDYCVCQISHLPIFPTGSTLKQVPVDRVLLSPLFCDGSLTNVVRDIGLFFCWQTSRRLWFALPHRAAMDFMVKNSAAVLESQ